MSGPTVNRCCMCGQDPCICLTKEEKFQGLVRENARLLAENARLREALEEINQLDTYNEASYGRFAEVARAALAPQDNSKKKGA